MRVVAPVVLAVAREIVRAVQHRTEEPFAPHLSIVYGTLAPAVKGDLAGRLAGIWPERCTAEALEVVRTTGPVTSWKTLARFER